jgi:copper(I)-binding protein
VIGKQVRILGVGSLLLFGLALVGCTPATSDVSASDAWVRAATANATGEMDTSNESSTSVESGTSSMDMETATPAMDMSSSGGGVSAAYMTLTNQGGAADTLISVATDVAGVVELHTSELDSSGVMRMRPLTDGLEIPANGSVSLSPGGYHVMLMNLRQDLVEGETVPLTLTFESGKTLTVEAEVRPPQ